MRRNCHWKERGTLAFIARRVYDFDDVKQKFDFSHSFFFLVLLVCRAACVSEHRPIERSTLFRPLDGGQMLHIHQFFPRLSLECGRRTFRPLSSARNDIECTSRAEPNDAEGMIAANLYSRLRFPIRQKPHRTSIHSIHLRFSLRKAFCI